MRLNSRNGKREKRNEFFILWFIYVVLFVFNRTFEVKEQSDEI